MNKRKILALSLLWTTSLFSASPVNFLRPHDINLRPSYWQEQRLQLTTSYFYGVSSDAWNGAGTKVSHMNYLHNTQNAYTMLKGYPAGSEEAAILTACGAVVENGVTGHFVVDGTFKINHSIMAGLTYHVNESVWMGLYLPAYDMSLKNTTWTDQTLNISFEEQQVKSLITDSIHSNVSRLGQGLSLTDWHKTGLGDLSALIGWRGRFVQYKPWLKGVDTNVKVGLTIPTGEKKDEDKVLSFAMGNDGTWGLIVGAGIDLNFKHWIDAGVEVEFMHLFNNTRQRRIKTHRDQTDLLLLTKTAVNVDHGFTQKFNLYVEPHFRGLSVRIAYQHIKQGGTTLYVVSNDYSSITANTAESIKEWTTHNVIGMVKFDTATEENKRFRPQVQLYFNQPFNGRRSIQTSSVGCGLTFNF